MYGCRDQAALDIFPTAATRRRNMDASYTALLLCCRVHGRTHPLTKEAYEDTLVTDPQGWVPLLLAGLAYPSLTRAPGVLQGSKEEATVRGLPVVNRCQQQQQQQSYLRQARTRQMLLPITHLELPQHVVA
jgi:hypothetical protein